MMRRYLLMVLCLVPLVRAEERTPVDSTGPAGASDLARMQTQLPAVPEWTQWQQQTGEGPPDFAALPKSNRLPDPLRFLDGRAVTSPEQWAERREEIWRLFQRYVTGSFPPPPRLQAVERSEEQTHEGYRVRDVLLRFASAGRSGTVRVQLTIPEGARPAPALVTPGFAGWAPRLVRRGYVSVGFAGNDRTDDGAALAALYPEFDFATLPRRAWLVPVVVDYLETVPEVRADQIALFGYSRDGKMAALAAALEPRIAALIAGSTGVGGFLPWRLAGERGSGEGIESTTRMFPHWFHPRLRYFSGREDRLPVDGHLLLALAAPRPVLIEYGLNDEVSSVWGVEQSRAAALPVYELLGAPNAISLLRSSGFHGGLDAEACLDWLDTVFGRSRATWTNETLFVGATVPLIEAGVSATRVVRSPEGMRSAVRTLLGDPPPFIPTTGARAAPSPFPRRPPPPGPVEVARGAPVNPGQLAPDVPAWVISRGGQEFGWLEPPKDQVQSRRIRFGQNLEGHLYWPLDTPAEKRLPVVVWLHGYSFPLGYMWVYRRDLHPILALTEAGFAVFAFDQAGFGSRQRDVSTFYARHPQWSLLGRMVQDVQHAIDALEEEAVVDPHRISLLGYTLGGAVALHAAALDPRVKQVVSVAGFTPLRSDRSENGLTGLERYYRDLPLIPRLAAYESRREALPYDYEDLLTAIAPRRVLVVQPLYDRDALPDEVREAVATARRRAGTDGAAALHLLEPEDYARLTTATQTLIIDWLKTPH